MKKINNLFGKIIFLLFTIFLIGTIYFYIYHNDQINSPLANFFLYSGLATFIIAIIYGRNNIKGQMKEAYSPANSNKSLQILLYLFIGGSIINIISKFIGGSKGYTIGLILGLFWLAGLFLLFRKRK